MRGMVGLLACALFTSGCLQSQEAPPLAGPSGFGLALDMAARPDSLPRDGSSSSVIQVKARRHDGSPWSGTLTIYASTGTVSSEQVSTNGNGEAAFVFTAPGIDENVSLAEISVVPVDTDFGNATYNTVKVALRGPSVPVAAFTTAPAALSLAAPIIFDASLSSVGSGARILRYDWSFGDGSSASVTSPVYVKQGPDAYAAAGTFVVTLTITDSLGRTATRTSTITVVP